MTLSKLISHLQKVQVYEKRDIEVTGLKIVRDEVTIDIPTNPELDHNSPTIQVRYEL